ncbi:MAG: phosphatase PAP2 family protein [Chloroflexi bacterium]|nr:MAG: phosphatase PAP2 family protein [Chloroflexota bacterium]
MIILAGRSHVLGGDFSILRVYNEWKSSVNRIHVKTPLEDYMQPLIDFGISLVIVLQRMGEWVYPIMTFFSELGSEEFFFLAMPLIYWCIDSTLGLRVGFILVTSIYLNAIGKAAFAGPRPYWVSSHVRPLWAETGFGVPSGHAQNALSIWGTIASHRRRIWVTVLCVFLILMISFSRLVLGAHFPHDVVVGWLIGGALLWAFSRYWEAVENWLAGKSFVVQVRIAFLVSMVFVVMGMVVYNLLTDYQLPQDWLTNALRSGLRPDPTNPTAVFSTAGTFFGLALGVAWTHQRGGYQAAGPGWKRVLRFILGFIGILILWQGLGAVFPRSDDLVAYSLRYLRYALVGCWISGGAPWVFKHFNLTTS